jgi:hypothetical protein
MSGGQRNLEGNIWGNFEHFWPVVWPQDTNKIIYYFFKFFFEGEGFPM